MSIQTSLILASLSAFLLPAAANARVLDQSAQGFTLENQEQVTVSPERVWQALTAEVGAWWPADHTWFGKAENLSIAAVAGGCFCEVDGARQAQHMVISYIEPGKLLRMLGGLGPLQGMGISGVLEWRIQPTDQGSRISLYYRAGGYSPEDISQFVAVVDAVQAQQLAALARYAEGRKP